MSGAPQSSQNFDEGSFSAEHFGQRIASAFPQLAQNFRPVLLSVPHLLQRMFPGPRLAAQLVEQCLGLSQIGGVEALGEPAVNFDEHRACLVAFALLFEQPGETHRRAQFR